jgi:hypothetical protein
MYRNRVPAYQEISHFRAPYKNVWSMGATTDAPPPPPGPGGALEPPGGDDAAIKAMYDVQDGVHVFKPAVRDQIMAMLMVRRVIFITDDRVNTVPYSPEEIEAMKTPEGQAVLAPLQASKWVTDRIKQKKVVFAPPGILMPEGAGSKELAAIPASDDQAVKLAGSTPYAGVLGGYSTGMFANITMTNVAVAVAALAAVGGGLYLYKNRSKSRRPTMPTPF